MKEKPLGNKVNNCHFACHPDGQVIVLVDGEPQTIQLRDNTQHFALVKADPCLKHEISMKVRYFFIYYE